MKRIKLTREECYCGLNEFYSKVAEKAGVTITDNTFFDCRKICITKHVQDEIWSFYELESKCELLQVSTILLLYGPKATLDESRDWYYAEIEDDFTEG